MAVTTSEADAPEAAVTVSQHTTPLVIVSCDTHIGPRLQEDLRAYCPQPYLEEFDAYAGALAARRAEAAAKQQNVSFAGVAQGADWGVRKANLHTPGHFDMHARIRDLDRDGVAAEVLFHDSQNGEPMPFSNDAMFSRNVMPTERDLELFFEGQKIYNRWLADQCSIEPERHIGLMYLPLWDTDLALDELEWGREHGLKAVNFPSPKSYLQPYNDPAWAPFFSAVEANDIALCCHGGAVSTGGTYPGAMSIAKLEISMMSRICPMDHLIYGGVLERHPGLRYVVTESPGVWWQFVLAEMDSIYLTDCVSYGPSEKERVPRMPSDYAKEQVFVGASFHSRFEAEDAIANGYADRVIWGSDYPHFEGTYQYDAEGPHGEPMTWASLRFTYAGLPYEQVRMFLGGNAMNAYDLDYDALQKVADRINAPTYDDLNTDAVTEKPEGAGHLAFRTFGFWA